MNMAGIARPPKCGIRQLGRSAAVATLLLGLVAGPTLAAPAATAAVRDDPSALATPEVAPTNDTPPDLASEPEEAQGAPDPEPTLETATPPAPNPAPAPEQLGEEASPQIDTLRPIPNKRVGVIGKSGIDWDWDPADHPSQGSRAYQWGSLGDGTRTGTSNGVDVPLTYTSYDLHWFRNYTDKPLSLTKLKVTKPQGFRGKLDSSNCALPVKIPARGYAVCETAYSYAPGDPRSDKEAQLDFVTSTGITFDTTVILWGKSAGRPGDGGPNDPNRGSGTPKPAKGPFWDVPASHKFVKPITWMKTTKLTTGNADGSYRPAAGLTREAMAAFLYRKAGKPSFSMPKKRFTDVQPGHKFYREIMWMKAAGLSTGHADGTYRPSATLTREAMAAFLYRQAGKPKVTKPKPDFWDVRKGHKFYREITWMRAAGITTGNADGTYRAKQPVTREAMAAFLYRQAGSPRV